MDGYLSAIAFLGIDIKPPAGGASVIRMTVCSSQNISSSLIGWARRRSPTAGTVAMLIVTLCYLHLDVFFWLEHFSRWRSVQILPPSCSCLRKKDVTRCWHAAIG